MIIFLIGFMGSGKTTIGRHLSGLIDFDFVDTDHFIEMQQGSTISELFTQHGEDVFREMERNILLEILKLEYVVVSTGGGLPCHGNNMDVMLAGGRVAYLKTSPQALCRRLLHSNNERPLIRGKTEKELQQYIVAELAEREPFYNRAHIKIQTENFLMENLLQALHLMKKRNIQR